MAPPAIGRFVRSIDRLSRLKHRRLYAYWDGLRGPGRPLPSRRDIEPSDIPDLLANIWLTDVVGDGGELRFRERLIGTALARLYGRDMTGRFFEEIYQGEHLKRQLATYREVIARGLPHLSRLRVPVRERDFILYDRLMLPLAGDHRTPDMILGIHAYQQEAGEPDINRAEDGPAPDVMLAGQ